MCSSRVDFAVICYSGAIADDITSKRPLRRRWDRTTGWRRRQIVLTTVGHVHTLGVSLAYGARTRHQRNIWLSVRGAGWTMATKLRGDLFRSGSDVVEMYRTVEHRECSFRCSEDVS